jgi:hypothetical protein
MLSEPRNVAVALGRENWKSMQGTDRVEMDVSQQPFWAPDGKALDLPPGPEGWIVTCRSTHPEVIEAVKGGSMLELSIKGEAERVPIDG